MSVTSLKNLVERGRLGKNVGMTMGLPKLETVIDGVAQGVYTLIFGSTGSGKTSFALYAYIYRPLMDNLDNDTFKVIYYSLEMSAEMLLGKLASMYMLEHFGVELSVKDLLSKNKDNILSDEHYEIFLKTIEFLNKLESKLLIYDKALTADRMYAHLSTEMLKYGVEEETEHRRIYHLNNPEQITLVIIDHIALIRKDKGRTKKEEIDLCSNYLVTFRNRYRVSPLVIMQMNRASSAMDRRSAGFSEPQLDDIKESGGPSEDSEIVLAVFHPYKEKMTSYKGYKVNALKNTFRAICCLKNRYGDTDVSVGCCFYGKVGIWKELPKAEEINDYEQYLEINNERSSQYKDIEKADENKEIFKFIL